MMPRPIHVLVRRAALVSISRHPVCREEKIKFSSTFFKRWRIPKAEPLVALRRGRNPQNDTQKIRKGSQNVPVGRFGEGEPYQGVPRRTQSCTYLPPNKNRAAKKRITLRLAGAVFRFGWIRSASCRNFFEIAAAGTSAGGLRAAFFLFWVAPGAQRSKISLSAESEEGRCPSTLPAF